MTARFAEPIIALAVLAVAGLMLHEAYGIGAPAQVFPLVVLLFVVGLTCVWLLRLLVSASVTRAFLSSVPARRRDLLIITCALLVFALAMQFDFALAAFIFTAALTAYLGGRRGMREIVPAMIWGALLSVFVAFAFRYWLNVALPAGLGW